MKSSESVALPAAISATLSAVLLALAAPSAYAGAADAGSAADPATGTLEEIVVTAEKRASTIQDTPISMSARSGAELQAEGITDLTGVIREIPGMSMRTAGPGQTELEMRGLSSSGGASPTVGFYLNDYPLSPPAAALVGKVVIDPDLFDLNRVEVLRGPQGTLYGSGSMGGTVKLVTAAPTLNTFSATINGLASETSSGGGFNKGGNAMLNLPLVNDLAAMRIVLTDKYTEGYIDRIVLNPFPLPGGAQCGFGNVGCTRGNVLDQTPTDVIHHSNNEHLQGGRAEVVVFPTDRLQVEGSVMYQRITDTGYSEFDSPPGPSPVLAHYQPYNLAEPFEDTFHLVGTTITYDLDFAKLTSATAYYARKESQNQDDAEAYYSFFTGPFKDPIGIPPETFNETDTTQQISEELRLTSSGSGALQWILGAYFARFESTFNEYSAYPGIANAGNPAGIIYQAHNPYHIKQSALFGESTYAITEMLKLTTGLRAYHFDSGANEEVSGFASTTGTGAQLPQSFSTANSGLNPKATLGYEPSRDLTVYGTIARGFRPGGINQQVPSNQCSLSAEAFGPDSTWNYEVGEKAKLLGNRLTVNADVYYIRWSQVQQTVNQPCGYPLSVNAGNAVSYGPELEIAGKITPDLVGTFSGTYTHAELTSVSGAITQNDAGLKSGTALLNIPKYTVMASLNYTTPITDTKKLSMRVSDSYVGSATDIAFTYETLPSYNLVGARIGVLADKWSVFLFGDNLTDTHAQLGVNTSSFAFQGPSLVRVATNQPRTIGLDLTYRF